MNRGSRIGDRGTRGQGCADAGLSLAGLGLKGGAHADKALAALREISAEHKVELTAGAGNLLRTCGLRIDLTEEVHIHGVVDRDKVVDLADHIGVIRVVDRRAHAARVVV